MSFPSEPKNLNYLDECDEQYIEELNKCCCLLDIQKVTEKWQWIARDAYLTTMAWSQSDFKAFQKWRELEAKGEFQGEQQAVMYGVVLMPEKLFKVSIVKSQFHVPWGIAYKRMKDEGLLK